MNIIHKKEEETHMIESIKEKIIHYWTDHKMATIAVGVVVVVLILSIIT